jgi:hypothetical protein
MPGSIADSEVANDVPARILFVDVRAHYRTEGDSLVIESIWPCHPEIGMCDAFTARFSGLPDVRVVRGRFEDLPAHDCFVTARNGFGLMTAGIDAALSTVLASR